MLFDVMCYTLSEFSLLYSILNNNNKYFFFLRNLFFTYLFLHYISAKAFTINLLHKGNYTQSLMANYNINFDFIH